MKRIALTFLSVISLMACNDKVEDPVPPTPNAKEISLNIHIPKNSLSTYAGEDASALENRIDSLFIDLYQGASTTPIHHGKFGGTDLTRISDSVVMVGYEVDNITTGTLTVQVYANKRGPAKINNEIPIPTGALSSLFYMSGKATLTYTGTAYAGKVHVSRNVAKLRINVSKNNVVLPSDLGINYSGVKVEVVQTADSTSWFDNMPLSTNFTSYSVRTGANLRPINNNIATFNGGQIDSLYLYENLRGDSYTGTGANGTKIKVTIPTTSPSEGNKTSEYTYTLHTNMTKYAILRNYIYTLDIKVRGQSLDPLITLDIQPWNDINIEGSVYGTYLTMDDSEIAFDSNGEATINFCTDAQAIYFDYSQFNSANDAQIGFEIETNGIEDADPDLAPEGFQDGQVLLDKQHCGSFGFKLYLGDFPDFPAVNFSGKICLRAGNIVKCLSFPARNTYDAHFIVGEGILNGETFTNAFVTMDNGVGNWLEVSTNRLYTGASTTYTGPAAPLFLHLNENLSGSTRTGSIVLINSNSNVEKKIYISQLPAIKVGKFGYTAGTNTDANVYTADLYTEQLYEYSARPVYINLENNSAIPGNALYNGRMPSIATFSLTDYNNQFNYQNTKYPAMNYCAQKNRITSLSNLNTELKWYLPAQAQLMAMWISYESYKEVPTANFYTYVNSIKTYADIHWSTTDNTVYSSQAQYVDFRHGNVGHYERALKYWVRCVRDGGGVSSMVTTTSGYPVIDFSSGMPASSYTTTTKGDGTGNENSSNNKTLYKRLRVAASDHSSGTTWSTTACNGYSEGGVTGWRLPTQRELQSIWVLQNDIKTVYNAFKLLDDNYYWSATSSEQTPANRWIVYGSGSQTLMGGAGNTPNIISTENNISVRCVKEMP